MRPCLKHTNKETNIKVKQQTETNNWAIILTYLTNYKSNDIPRIFVAVVGIVIHLTLSSRDVVEILVMDGPPLFICTL